ncbi:MAG: hypothetical protein LPK45_07605 [Bacteroidota bacterium]|nr:hypothetical protein [Bacteroidota bacterium]MDX5430938.1 hypothetical protein [Bacteroidota bacterium]MDX5469686.1 hypothetical protein [Bacteroidota bacterium]
MILFKAYRAIDDYATCQEYAAGHRRVLEGFKLTNISTNNLDWAENPNVYVVIAQSLETGNLLGGIRIQVADGVHPLPVEDAVSHFDPKVHDMVNEYRINGGTGELCGLWNSREEAPNMGITLNLVLAGMSLCNQLPITSLFTIVAKYTLKIALQVGYRVEKGLGNSGEFVYPNSNYVARVLSMNPQTLEFTYDIYKDQILNYRNNPEGSHMFEAPNGQSVKFNYQLTLPNITPTGQNS